MAEQVAQQTNGVAKAAPPDVLPGPSRAQQAAERVRSSRAATLAAIESGKFEDAANPEPVKAAEPTVEEPAKPEPVAEPEAEPTEPAEEGETEEKPEPAEVPADPEAAKRIAAIQAAERRSKEKLAKEKAEGRAEIERERQAIQAERAQILAEREQMEAFKKAQSRAKIDAASYLEAAGINTPEEMEYAAQVIYARSQAAKDPKQRDAYARMIRERENTDRTSATEKRIAELEAKLEAKDRAVAEREAWSSYLELTVKTIGDEAPIAKKMAASKPDKLRSALKSAAEHLIAENDGDVPTFDEVVSLYEKTRRAELEELGVDIATFTATTPKQNTQTADKKHPAKTLGNDLSTPRVPRPAKSDREHRAETLAMLESGKLE